MPAPKRTMTATQTMRTASASTPRRAASPAHTPPTIPLAGSRRSRCSADDVVASVPTAPIVSVPRQPGDQQHDAHGREDGGSRVVEAQVEHAGAVECEQRAEQRHDDAGDDGDEIGGASHVRHAGWPTAAPPWWT